MTPARPELIVRVGVDLANPMGAHAMVIHTQQSIRLTTGPLNGTRVVHARRLREARWKRRRERREGIPAKVRNRWIHYPRVWIDEVWPPSQVG